MEGTKESNETLIIEERITKVNGDFHIKKWARGKFLGKGGFAKVYCFTNLENNKILAGKVMPKANLNRSRSRQKLMVEIRLHKSIRHPNIVKFEHVFEDGENVYILLELCENQSMNELLKRRKRLTEFEVQCYLIQMVDALKYLHANRIIHRDLKLGNMFLSDKMQIKMGDFGLAAKLEFDGEKKRTVCGTPNYIAPEILDGNIGHSYQVDIWSLGVVIYTLIIGRPPFETTDIKLTYKKIKDNDFSFPDSANISENAKDLIRKILVTEPEKRLTLDEILMHPFINHGGPIPQFMPASTLACPPTSSYMKQFAATSTSQRIRIATEPDAFDPENFLKTTKNGTQTTRNFNFNMLRSPTMGDAPTNDLFGVTPKIQELFGTTPKTPKLNFFGNDRFNLHGTLPTEKAKAVVQTPKTPQLKGLVGNAENNPGKGENPKEVNKSVNKSSVMKIEQIEEVRIVKYYDYSVKYGLGYALSNGAVGVFFNDGAKIIAPPGDKFEYIVRRSTDKQDVSTTYNYKEYPQDVNKRVLVLNKFKEHFESAIKNPLKQDTSVYIKKWIKTKQATFFRMNNRTLQVTFKDDTVLIMNSNTKKLTYIDTKGNVVICGLEHAATSDNKDIAKRVKYSEEVLRQIWSAQETTKSHISTQLTTQESEPEIHGIDLNKNIFENPEAVAATVNS